VRLGGPRAPSLRSAQIAEDARELRRGQGEPTLVVGVEIVQDRREAFGNADPAFVEPFFDGA
jgi:hypothetical protein